MLKSRNSRALQVGRTKRVDVISRKTESENSVSKGRSRLARGRADWNERLNATDNANCSSSATICRPSLFAGDNFPTPPITISKGDKDREVVVQGDTHNQALFEHLTEVHRAVISILKALHDTFLECHVV